VSVLTRSCNARFICNPYNDNIVGYGRELDMPRFVISVLIATGLCSAAHADPQAPSPRQATPAANWAVANPAVYQSAYFDGCSHATTGVPRNETKFATDAAYHEGWIHGYSSCRSFMPLQNTGDPNGPLKNLF
jgi:hypothetical protein